MHNTRDLAAFLALLIALPATSAELRPKALEFSMRGMGHGPSLSFKRGQLYCEVRTSTGTRKSRLPAPTNAAWSAFRADLDRLMVWSWHEYYSADPLAEFDGNRWSLRVRYADTAMASDGANAYPLFDGGRSQESEPSRAFESLLSAIRRIAPDCPF